jgi:hypothetical protein
LENRRTKLVLPVALVVVGRGRSVERVYDGGYGANTVYNLCKWRNETYKLVQEWWEQGYRRMVLGENSSMICLTYCKDFCKSQNVITKLKNRTIRNNFKSNNSHYDGCSHVAGGQLFGTEHF